MTSNRARRSTAWIALAAILFAALVPTLSLAARPITAADIAHLNGICTAIGYQSAAAPTSEGERSQTESGGDAVQFEHCPFCVKLGGDWIAQRPGEYVVERLISVVIYPRLFLFAPRPMFAWAPAQARAPPSVS